MSDGRGASGLVGALRAERRALGTSLRTVGPDAATLVQGWLTRDLAAHVAALERQRGLPTFVGRTAVSRYGWRLNDTFRPVMAMDLRRFRRHGFDWALRRLEGAGPRLLERPSLLPVSLFEIFVHHEDVRRANALERTLPVPDLVPVVRWLLHYHRRLLRSARLVIELPRETVVAAGAGGAPVTLRGEPEEVVLWLAGRRDAAVVQIAGGEGAPGVLDRLHI